MVCTILLKRSLVVFLTSFFLASCSQPGSKGNQCIDKVEIKPVVKAGADLSKLAEISGEYTVDFTDGCCPGTAAIEHLKDTQNLSLKLHKKMVDGEITIAEFNQKNTPMQKFLAEAKKVCPSKGSTEQGTPTDLWQRIAKYNSTLK